MSHNQAAKEVNETNASLNYLKIIKKGWSFVVNIISNPKWINFHLWVISIWLDPVMCYVLSIHDEEKLLKINSELMTVIWILYWTILLYRLLSVGVAMISGETRKVWKDFFFKKMRTFIEKQGDKATRPTTTSDNNARGTGQQPRPTAKAEQQEQSHQATSVSQRKGKVWTILLYKLSLVVVAMSSRETKTVWKVFNVVESMALLFSSVLLNSLVLIPKMEISAPVFSFALVIFLFVYLIRIIGIFRLFTEEVTRISSKSFADSAFVKILLNLQLFFYGGHLFGGLWYLFAVWKKMECWKKACSNHSGCHYANNRFNVIFGDNKFLNDICLPKMEDTKIYELGIFKDALESQIVEMTTGLWRKFLYCFRWGIQNISGFGQNLQNVLNSAIDKKSEENIQENKLIQRQPHQWLDFEKLSEKLQNHIKQYNWQQTGDADVENLFSNLLKDVRNNIKRELYLEMLKKVERFRRLSDTSLLHLCDCVKPVVYTGRTRIVREGDPFNEMLFVLHGKVCNFSSAASSTNNVPPLDRRKEFLKDGDFWGEELLNWVQDESSSSSSSNKLISQTTIQALTKVEAFVLRIDDLKNLYNEKAKILQSWFRKIRIRISERNTQEKTPPPPGDQLTGPEIVV